MVTHHEMPGAQALRAQLREGRCSARDIVQDHVARIEALDPAIRAWQAFDPRLPLARADALDAAPGGAAAQGPLAGLPVGLKDLIDTRDWPTGFGSAVFAERRPAEDAPLVRQLLALGAVPMGKTVTTEFGYFQPGPTANPWNPAHTPGGSSSGSAAAVAAGMVPLAFGTQTAGSLIRPASYCGVWALKATHGRHGLAGVQGLSESLDTLGWMARSADDLELLRAALDGEPGRPLPETAPRLAWSRTREWPLMQPGGAAAFEAGIARLAQAGVLAREWWPPDPLGGLFEAQKTIMAHEAAQHLATLLAQHGPHLSAPLRQLLDLGLGLGAAEVAAAHALARQGREVLDALLGEVDALVVPAAPGEAPAGLQATGDPAFSRVWNLLGHPCVNVPGLLGPQGLPVGLQLVGRRGAAGERALLATARTVGEIIHGMISGHECRPPITRPAGP